MAYPQMLHNFLTVHRSTIHGDLNLENILIDPETHYLHLIDFAAVRQGHVLHDLLRLETEIVTKLVPAALSQARLPATAIYTFYQQLHLVATHQADPSSRLGPLPAGLEKPLVMLTAIRQMGRNCLFNPKDWTEYYQGLTLYLLGALKFKNLETLPAAPLPKQVAFWGAATSAQLSQQASTIQPKIKMAHRRPKLTRVWLALAGVFIIMAAVAIVIVAGLWLIQSKQLSSSAPVPPTAVVQETDGQTTGSTGSVQPSYAIGQPLETENLMVMVEGFAPFQAKRAARQPAAGNELLQVFLTIENRSNEVLTFKVEQANLVDATGQKFTTIGQGNVVTIGPNRQRQGGPVFEVPQNASGLTFVLDLDPSNTGDEFYVPLTSSSD